MIYPSYRVIDAEGNFRSFFWFCFARLKYLDRDQNQYDDFLGTHYQNDGKMPLWKFGEGNGHKIGSASDVVRIEVAFHSPNWGPNVVKEILSNPLFEGFQGGKEGDFIVVGIDTANKKVREIMYALFMLRDIFSAREVYEQLVDHLSITESAFLASQFDIAKDFRGTPILEWIGDDYRLAATFEGLAKVMTEKPVYHGVEWGFYPEGYREDGSYTDLPEDAFDIEAGQNIEDVIEAMEDLEEPMSFKQSIEIIRDHFKHAMEKVNAKA